MAMGPGTSEPENFGWRWLVVLALAALALVALERAFSILSRPPPQAPFAAPKMNGAPTPPDNGIQSSAPPAG